MELIQLINRILGIALTICFSYQALYIIVALWPKRKRLPDAPLRTFAVLIAARNEEMVIKHLIDSIAQQDYPRELISVFVVADNCDDTTAETARAAGAIVYERFNRAQVGKGYAMQYLVRQIWDNHGTFDSYLVFDADNILDRAYITEMNKALSGKNQAVTGYRNSKNYGTNWLTAGTSLWFIRESQYLNRARHRLQTSCAVGGTGFGVNHTVLEHYGGWNWFLLTEDTEFSVRCILDGYPIGYCDTAVVYDEQPETVVQSFRQRLRWTKGYMQILCKDGLALLRGIPRCFACFDMLAVIAPAFILGAFSLAVNGVALCVGLYENDLLLGEMLWQGTIFFMQLYGALFGVGLITTITEWRRIRAKTLHKIKYIFTFPLFCATYLPISFVALFAKVTWKPIRHTVARSLDEI